MSNSRSFRRGLAVTRKAIDKRRKTQANVRRRKAAGRWPFGGPSMSSVRRWLKAAEAEGTVERKGVARTGKPGRPAILWGLTEFGEQHPMEGTYEDLLYAERVKIILRRAKGKPMTEDQIVAAHDAAMASVRERMSA